MYENRRRYVTRRATYSWLLVGLLVFVSIYMGRAVFARYTAFKDVTREFERTKSDVDTLASRRDYLKREVERLHTQSGVEREIREKFSVVKEGEAMVLIIDDNATQTPVLKPTVKRSWWSALFGE
jgi:cell division protein FtsB